MSIALRLQGLTNVTNMSQIRLQGLAVTNDNYVTFLVEYKIRAKSCHPDKNSHDPESQERFQRLLQVGLITFCVYIIENKLIEYLVLRKVLLIRPLIDAVSTYLIKKWFCTMQQKM